MKSTMVTVLSLLVFSGWLAPGLAEAALQYVGGTSGSGTAATYNVSLNGTLTGGIATSPAAGDLVVVVTGWASAADGNPGVTTVGYTEVYDGYGNDTRDANLSVSYKIMSASPDTSVTVSGFNNAANGGATVVHVWRGADQTTPMDVAAPSAPLGASAINAARPDSPAITPVTTGAVVLAAGLGTGAAAPTAMTAPTGFINGLSATGAGSTMGAVANIASQAWAGGAVDPAAWTGGATGTSDSWVAGTLAIRPAVGPASTLTDCGSCHSYPPTDGTARNTPEGEFLGDHAKHNFACSTCHVAPATETAADFAHRNGNINMATPIFGGSGSYSRTATFAQSNVAGLTGTCSNISCHNGAVTPQWGVGNTTCSSCHALPPATDAHTKHYTAKGWSTGVTTNCTVCHPDNSVAHSNVTDGVITVNGSLTPGGTSPAITCSATPTGCHNGLATPAWNTTAIACTACHTVGGGGANPTTGLHNITVAGPQHHDDGISGGCTACHNSTKPATHANGTFTANSAADTDRFINRLNMTWVDGAANTGTCAGTGLSGCHSDGGSWTRLWSTAANSTATTAGDTRCAVCHGQFGDWRVGTSHYNTFGGAASTRGDSHNSLTGAANACEDCHSYPTLIANHENSQITMNDGGATTVSVSGNSVWCAKCHSNDGLPSASGTHTFDTSIFTLQTVSGANDPVGDCSGCHGGGTIGITEKSFWPDSGVKNIDNAGSQDDEGAHVKHMTVLARRVYNLSLTGLLDDAASKDKQKALCEYCHAAVTNDDGHTTGDDAEVFVTLISTVSTRFAKHLNGVADANATYTTGACTNVDCHNSKSTATSSRNWYSGAASTCTMCHTPGGATNDPNSGLHTGASPTISAQKHDDTLTGGCVICHTTLPDVSATQAATHINGTFSSNGFNAGDKTNMGLFTAYTATADSIGSCSGAAVGGASCHAGVGDAGSWARRWNSAIHYVGTGAECAGCHGGFNSDWTFGSVANTTDGSVEHARDWQGADGAEVIGSHSNNTANTNKCNTCHVYGDAQYIMGTHHRNNQITMNSVPTYSSTTWNCSNVCHADNTGHNLEDSGWTAGSLAGPPMTCTTCHGGGTPAAGVSSTSTHTDADGAGTTYTSTNCEACHGTAAAGHADGTTGSNDVEISTVYTGTTAVPTMTKADGTTALYASHNYKIRLGGTATTGYAKSTEAEICWACHDANAISEWGTNTQTDTGNSPYNYGQLYTTLTGTTTTSNWVVSSFWRSGKGLTSSDPYWYKRGAVRSTHSANYDGTTAANDTGKPWKGTLVNTASAYSTTYNKGENLDTVANIRCTYCHDVHGTHNTIKGDNSTGSPYLRGTWMGNPYNEDGAPRFGMNFWTSQGVSGFTSGNTNQYGIVPRVSASPTNSGLSTVQNVGGWWIDQNSNNPVAGNTTWDTATKNAGLCDQCHGSVAKNGTWDAAEINVIDQITGEALWVSGASYNGHGNSVIGGSGNAANGGGATEQQARNIFSRTKRGSATLLTANSNKIHTDMGLATEGTGAGYSYRNSTGYSWLPRIGNGTTNGTTAGRYAFRYFAWNNVDFNSASTRSTVIATGTLKLTMSTAASEASTDLGQSNYHTFSCSKCHNPHASRLPKLMITNCLDTNHNTWEDNNAYTGTTTGWVAPWTGMRQANWATSQNCHRLDARATNNGTVTTGSGWNKVTPWIEDLTPNPASGSGKTAELTTLPTY